MYEDVVFEYISDSSIPHETFSVHVIFIYIQENWRKLFPLETTLEVIFYPPCSVEEIAKKQHFIHTYVSLTWIDWLNKNQTF